MCEATRTKVKGTGKGLERETTCKLVMVLLCSDQGPYALHA